MRQILIIITLLFISGTVLYFYKNIGTETTINSTSTTALATTKTIDTEVLATFKIVTNGTIRIFTDSKYHNQSDYVYIEKTEPNVVHIKKTGIKWSDFFETLPMSLDKKCLITGTKQTFCTRDGKVLIFTLNNIENPDALDEIIKNGDNLLVTFK